MVGLSSQERRSRFGTAAWRAGAQARAIAAYLEWGMVKNSALMQLFSNPYLSFDLNFAQLYDILRIRIYSNMTFMVTSGTSDRVSNYIYGFSWLDKGIQ